MDSSCYIPGTQTLRPNPDDTVVVHRHDLLDLLHMAAAEHSRLAGVARHEAMVAEWRKRVLDSPVSPVVSSDEIVLNRADVAMALSLRDKPLDKYLEARERIGEALKS